MILFLIFILKNNKRLQNIGIIEWEDAVFLHFMIHHRIHSGIDDRLQKFYDTQTIQNLILENISDNIFVSLIKNDAKMQCHFITISTRMSISEKIFYAIYHLKNVPKISIVRIVNSHPAIPVYFVVFFVYFFSFHAWKYVHLILYAMLIHSMNKIWYKRSGKRRKMKQIQRAKRNRTSANFIKISDG